MSEAKRRLEGRVAIVTGAGQGTGEGTARLYAREGAKLVLTGRTMSKLEAVASDIRAGGGEVRCLEALAGNRTDAERTVNEAISSYGRLDILVNAAQTYTEAMPVESIKEENLRINFESGVIGSLQLMQFAFPHMRKVGGGSIINFGSSWSYFCNPGFLAYAANKEAIRTLTKTAAREWGKYNIRVNTVLPAALTPKSRQHMQDTGTLEAESAKTSLGYIGDPENDVAPVMLFLASDESHYMTGQTVSVDGGMLTH
jgi:NAD(P)-dependent dehydrogenase (short-subunit alcohol dehydrogenase family)